MKYPEQDIIHVRFIEQSGSESFAAGEFPLALVYLDDTDINPNNVMHIKFQVT